MPKKRRNGRRYTPRDWDAEAARQRGKAERTKINKPAELPAAPHVAGPTHDAPRARALRPRYLVPAGAAALGGAGFLAYRSRRNRVSKSLIDPLTGDRVEIVKRSDETAVEHTVNRRASNRRGVLVTVKRGSRNRQVTKADDKPSAGRRATAAAFGGYHGAVAGRKGKKTRAFGNEVGGALAGSVAVHAATRGRLLRRANALGAEHALRGKPFGVLRDKRYWAAATPGVAASAGGIQLGVNRNQRKGYYKPQVAKADRKSPMAGRRGAFVPGGMYDQVSFSTGKPWERPGTSHANKLTHKKHRPRRNPTAKLEHYSKGMGSGFAQAGRSTGRRITVEV